MVGIATEDAQLISADMTADEDEFDGQSLLVAALFFGLYFAILTFAITKSVKSRRNGSTTGGSVRIPTSTFGSGTSNFGSSFTSGSSFGGGFGGGFSGGGGSFGGGGASGKW